LFFVVALLACASKATTKNSRTKDGKKSESEDASDGYLAIAVI
jgi:hypothetical protein